MSDRISQRGASVSAMSANDALAAWLSHHRFSARLSLQKMVADPLSNFMTCLIVGIALALPASLFVVAENIKRLSGNWDGNPQVSVFLKSGVSSAAAKALNDRLQHTSGVLSVVYVSPEAGLDEFRQYSGFGEALKLLDENPLPAVLLVKPLSIDAEKLDVLMLQLKAYPEVDYVQLDLAWVKKLQQILRLAEQFIFLFGILLCLGVTLAIGNTIRLAIENRRDEIVVVKLVGGTDAFVRRPLLYSGLWYGLAGGLLALILVFFVIHRLTSPSLQLALLYQSSFYPTGLSLVESLLLLLTSGLLGLLGAWIATIRHLQYIQPR